MLTKYGYFTIGIAITISFVLIIISVLIQNIPFRIVLILIALFIAVFTLNFFRDPERITPSENNTVVSPADGRVLFVKEVDASEHVGKKATQISIFMSPLNVHVNRIPIDGVIKDVKYYSGKYLVAYDDKASKENERSEFVIETKYGNVFFSQIAGFVARRIVYDLKKGDRVTKGERFGMIKFGSRVDIVVPTGWKSIVKKDDIVVAGETILFEINDH